MASKAPMASKAVLGRGRARWAALESRGRPVVGAILIGEVMITSHSSRRAAACHGCSRCYFMRNATHTVNPRSRRNFAVAVVLLSHHSHCHPANPNSKGLRPEYIREN